MSSRPSGEAPSVVRSLGELALRVNDLARMKSFYRDVVGLQIFEEFDGAVFFRVGDAVEGHPQTLVLFDRDTEVGQERTTIDHFAFLIALEDYEAACERLEGLGVAVRKKEFPHFRWRSLFFSDPDGNTVEFVCYDPSVS